ncbi:vacuolar sorting-associated protein 26 [Nitzschia inconspicua]|uniref:Vacuolar sorting-associated protein 26 n=1 Tax=Nitzschia inconspicua TaxID=303405 RepID=A0A9K3M591_9STRA|nr:vacuolar sorting-associated protein 26 [Nitzschia inconspicua]
MMDGHENIGGDTGQSVASQSNAFTSPMGGIQGDGAFMNSSNMQSDGQQQPYNAMRQQQQQQQQQFPPSTPGSTYGGGGMTSGMYGSNMSSPVAGSITQFATPIMKQQQQLQQQHQAMYNPPQNSPYNFTPPPQPNSTIGTGAGTGMSFAQRSAMMQQQAGAGSNVYGSGIQRQPTMQQAGIMTPERLSFPNQPQQQQLHQPPVAQIHVPAQPQQQQQQQVPSNAYQGGAGMSYAQRSQVMIQPSTPQQQQQQQQLPPPTQTNVPSIVPGGSNAMYSPTLSTPQQQQTYTGSSPYVQQQQQLQSQMQGSFMASQPGQQQQPPPAAVGSYAQRSAMMGQSPASMQQLQQPGGMPPQPSIMPPQQSAAVPVLQQPPPQPRNPMMDPPEVVAQQQRLLTDATRKVQEHAYYMKQAMERNDLPTVLDRAAQMVGELGEHAHAHHHHHIHPPAPGATGSTTALLPKNYYELHLRALEELPTLEDYLLNLSRQHPPQQGDASAAPGGIPTSPGNNPLMMGVATGATNQSMMMNTPTMNPQMMMGQQQQLQTQLNFADSSTKIMSYTMKELYDSVQYCPNVLSRLYLQICAASALIRSGEVGARWVLKDMIEAVKCVQNPVRGLFLRHYLLQAFRDKLPDEAIPLDQIGTPLGTGTAAPGGEGSNPVENVSTPAAVAPSVTMDSEQGTVKDSYEFILANFIEMNKLWVRIQHLPGDGKSIEIRRRREKDRNELRILVGTNLVRLSALDSITSAIYGQVILPTVLNHIVICGDPLAQAYLMDCLVQVFPDEYHIETMPILLGVCPKLRDKVNIRTILQSLMDRLANYLADEELLDEKDSNQVKRSVALDSFRMFDECVQNVYNARGPKLNPKEVIRLQTALLSFSMKCYKGNMEQIVTCLKNSVVTLQAIRNNAALMQDSNMQQQMAPPKLTLDEVSTKELEKLLSIPLDELALGVLKLDFYSDLISFLPWANRREVALTMLKAVSNSGKPPESVKEIDELFSVIAPVIRDEHDKAVPTSHQEMAGGMERTANLMAGLGVSPQPQRYLSQSSDDARFTASQYHEDAALLSKLIDMLDHSDTDILYEMLAAARNHLNAGKNRVGTAYMALVFASLKLSRRIYNEDHGLTKPKEDSSAPNAASPDEEGDTKVDNVAHDSDGNKTKEISSENDGAKGQAEDIDDADETTKMEDENKADEVSPVETPAQSPSKAPKSITCRKVFVFIQQTISSYAKINPEQGVKLFLEAATTADKLGQAGDDKNDFGAISYELISQAFALYEEQAITDSSIQSRCVLAMIGTLLISRSLGKDDYEGLIMKASKYSAKMLKKPEQCEMVALCAHLFYVVGEDGETVIYSNPQRCLECLQRSLKLADACTNTNPANLRLFVKLLDLYLYFFEKRNPSITSNYITGLVALVKEHVDNLGQFGGSPDHSPVGEARVQFLQIVRHINTMKKREESADMFSSIDVSSVQT